MSHVRGDEGTQPRKGHTIRKTPAGAPENAPQRDQPLSDHCTGAQQVTPRTIDPLPALIHMLKTTENVSRAAGVLPDQMM